MEAEWDWDWSEKEKKAPKPTFQNSAGFSYTFHLKGDIKGPEQYVEWIDIINNTTENDTITIHINTPGGDVTTALELMNALKMSKAFINMVISGQCCSAGTMLMTCGHSFVIDEFCTFMFHNYSGGTFGKGNEMHSQISFEKKWSENLMKKIYKDLLKPAEIKRLLEGQDYWMTSEEVGVRLGNMLENKYDSDFSDEA